MFFAEFIQNILSAGTEQLLDWITQYLPQIFLFLILLNAITRMIGRSRIERLAARCGSNVFLRYLVLPFLSAIILGNPMAISMGRYLPEKYKPAYFASVSYHCHTNNGIFSHINPAELFLWLGIAGGITSLGLDIIPLALRYMCAGLCANFMSGYVTEIITGILEKKKGITLSGTVELIEEAGNTDVFPADNSLSGIAGDSTASPADIFAGVEANAPSQSIADEATTAPSRDFSTDTASPYHSITITCGDGGYGGPVTVTPTEERHTVLFMTGGGAEPEPLAKILALSGMTAVNGTLDVVPDEEVALAIIDCGGTLRCGIYPGKGIPTVNLLATGRSGPLAKYMTADLYVSDVTSANVHAVAETAPVPKTETTASQTPETTVSAAINEAPSVSASSNSADRNAQTAATVSSSSTDHTADTSSIAGSNSTDRSVDSSDAAGPDSRDRSSTPALHSVFKPVAAVSRIVSVFYQSARDAVKTCLEILLPFMGFAALFIGICRGSGLTAFLAGLMTPFEGNLPGLFIVGIVCSIPGLSAILGAGAVAAQMFATVIGDLIIAGSFAPALALPALFAINCQCACDFIPVGLGMMEAKPETTQLGMSAVTLSRFATGWLRILIALLFSIGLYA